MKISLGFSPCPNDTFMFDALINQKIDTGDLEFVTTIADVEELNQMAFDQTLDVTKISFHALFKNLSNYQLLTAGSALGFGCGPLLISKKRFDQKDVSNRTICIPGENTTANLLMKYAFPNATKKTALLFSEIEHAVLNETFDAGVIIHENRFTYKKKGLHKIVDLGAYWESKTNLPIPLGGIAIKKNLDSKLKRQINSLLRESIQFAFDHPSSSLNYCKQYAQEMDEDVMQQHIKLYVNSFSLDLQEKGKAAIQELYSAFNTNHRSEFASNLYIE